MRAFVTGGTGFVGGRLAAALRARGDEVVALARARGRAGRLRELGCDVVLGDVEDDDGIRRRVEDCDAVFMRPPCTAWG